MKCPARRARISRDITKFLHIDRNDDDLTLRLHTMAKHPRKRQKTSKASECDTNGPNKSVRLEMLLDDESKDDEERRLESLLFGVKYVPREGRKGKMKENSDDEYESDEDLEEEGGRGLQHLMDQDVRQKFAMRLYIDIDYFLLFFPVVLC